MTATVARTISELFELAESTGAAKTRRGGWLLVIESSTGRFALFRYHHLMLAGNIRSHLLTHVHPDMLKTDRAGVNRFLERFGFTVRL